MGKLVAEKINHLNYPDEQNRVYCRVANEILSLAETKCHDCPLWYGTLQGMGTECFYVDLISANNDALALPVAGPQKHFAFINKMIGSGHIPTDPFYKMGTAQIEHYANVDDDNENSLGADIFASVLGMSVEEALDETDGE